MRLFLFILLSLFTVSCGERNAVLGLIPSSTYAPDKELPKKVDELKAELAKNKQQSLLIELALKDAKAQVIEERQGAIQTKLWIGAGLCAFAGLLLIGLGVWTTRAVLIQIGVGAFGLGGLCIFAAWLVPYALYIGLGVGVLVAGAAVYMLVNRDKALKKTTNAIEELKTYAPKWKEVLVKHVGLGTKADKLIQSIRPKKDV